jgi:hypothetical protein
VSAEKKSMMSKASNSTIVLTLYTDIPAKIPPDILVGEGSGCNETFPLQDNRYMKIWDIYRNS